jgi:hypothetical protein
MWILSATAAGHRAPRQVMEKLGLALQGEITFRRAVVVWLTIDRPEIRGNLFRRQELGF